MADRLSVTFSALADPTRRAILARLSHGEASVSQLCEPFEISMPAISRHLKFRPVALDAEPLRAVAGWVETYRQFWGGAFDRMDTYLAELQKGDPDAKQ
jgi:DNA-binding transcriptional ArsR family regulator